jgi:hypothetical protein
MKGGGDPHPSSQPLLPIRTATYAAAQQSHPQSQASACGSAPPSSSTSSAATALQPQPQSHPASAACPTISSVPSATWMPSSCSGRAAPDVPGIAFVPHHAFKLELDVSEPADLGPDQGQPCLHERPYMPAPALATIPDLEKLREILKPQAQPLVVPLCPTPSPPPSSGALTSWKGRLQPNGLCQINVEYIYMDSGSTGNAADRDWAHQLSSPRSVTNRGGARARKAPVT